MQDEERYMTLNVQLEKRRPSQTSQLKFKGMEFRFCFFQVVWINMGMDLTWVNINLNINVDSNF